MAHDIITCFHKIIYLFTLSQLIKSRRCLLNGEIFCCKVNNRCYKHKAELWLSCEESDSIKTFFAEDLFESSSLNCF